MANAKKCGKCNSEGRLAHYAHVDGGVCFACNGTGMRDGKSVNARELMAVSIRDYDITGVMVPLGPITRKRNLECDCAHWDAA